MLILALSSVFLRLEWHQLATSNAMIRAFYNYSIGLHLHQVILGRRCIYISNSKSSLAGFVPNNCLLV